jgi:pantoate--beta-alanine ligase
MKCYQANSPLVRESDLDLPVVVESIEALRELLEKVRRRAKSIGFVPTMGALHAGHTRLLEIARQQNDFVVASIFVNPLQFDRKDDLGAYPRTFSEDLAICSSFGVDAVFAPGAEEIYPSEQLTFVEVPALCEHLCGQFRPGHFRGVATVVLKLFNIVRPDSAYFGQKDAQQLSVIRRMVQDLNLPINVVPVPTVREPDGLALSSRNKHLTPEQRAVAPVLYRALCRAVELLESGQRSVSVVSEEVFPLFTEIPEVRLEYFEITDPNTLRPLDQVEGPALIAGAMFLGCTRLIDNIIVQG